MQRKFEVRHKHFKKMVENLLKGIHVLGGLRPAEPLRMLNVCSLNKDQHLTARELDADLGTPKTTVSKILTQDLGMKRVVAKFILWLLLTEQEERCAAVAKDLIQTTTNEPDFLKKVITGDEWWVYGYDLETKAPLSPQKLPGSPCWKKAQRRRGKFTARSRP